MFNDSLFNAFARTYEARSQTDMSMSEYLESCRGDPMRYAGSLIASCVPAVTARRSGARMC